MASGVEGEACGRESRRRVGSSYIKQLRSVYRARKGSFMDSDAHCFGKDGCNLYQTCTC